jgi:hypothetical protein
MRLSQPFCRLDLRFDVERLRAEISALPPSAWVAHPNGIAGNSAVRLISAGGGENDAVDGLMQPTPHLAQLPYVRQLLAGFGVAWSRSRLLRLAPGASVPSHADINYHWFNRVRLHVPILTLPEVLFHCGGQTVHMAAGEAWLFDNWRPHSVENPTAFERIHLVADTAGSAAFWDFAARSGQPGATQARLPYDPTRNAQPLTERGQRAVILPAAEVEYLVHDLAASLVPRSGLTDGPGRLARYRALLAAFCQDWRQLHALHGDDEASWPHYAQLRDALRGPSPRTRRRAGRRRQRRSGPQGAGGARVAGRCRNASQPSTARARAAPCPRTTRLCHRRTPLRQHPAVRDAGRKPPALHRGRRSALADRKHPCVARRRSGGGIKPAGGLAVHRRDSRAADRADRHTVRRCTGPPRDAGTGPALPGKDAQERPARALL